MDELQQSHGESKLISDKSLQLFFARACEVADRAASGGLSFLDAVDFIWSSAEFSGLLDRVGADRVQLIMSRAFADAKADAA